MLIDSGRTLADQTTTKKVTSDNSVLRGNFHLWLCMFRDLSHHEIFALHLVQTGTRTATSTFWDVIGIRHPNWTPVVRCTYSFADCTADNFGGILVSHFPPQQPRANHAMVKSLSLLPRRSDGSCPCLPAEGWLLASFCWMSWCHVLSPWFTIPLGSLDNPLKKIPTRITTRSEFTPPRPAPPWLPQTLQCLPSRLRASGFWALQTMGPKTIGKTISDACCGFFPSLRTTQVVWKLLETNCPKKRSVLLWWIVMNLELFHFCIWCGGQKSWAQCWIYSM